jgi:putative transposase
VHDVLTSERFVDRSPAQVWATLLDEGRYLCSERTMYRVLDDRAEVRERRDQLRHPTYSKPELLAEQPNQLWSWDITKLLGPAKWTYFYLYVILDVFSRYVVGWTVQYRKSARVAEQLIAQAVAQHRIAPGRLTVHADRGSAMTSKPVAFLLADLGVTKTLLEALHLDRQPVLGGALQDAEVLSGIPASARSSTRGRSAGRSSAGTITSTGTRGSAS